MSPSQKKVLATGFAILAIGLLFNEFTLVRILSPDGQLQAQNLLLLRLFAGTFIVLGVLIAVFSAWISRHKKEILLTVGTTFACVFLLEIALRIIKPDQVIDMYRENPHGTGSYRHIPNYSTQFDIYADRFYISTNSHGMTWREVEKEKKPGVHRIAFVGDSFTMGWLADKVEKSMVGVVDSLIGNEKTEILNFGVGGYGTTDEELLIKEEVLGFKPDTIVLNFFGGNDFKDVFLGLDKFVVTDGELLRNKEAEKRLPIVYKPPKPPKPLLTRIKGHIVDSFILETRLYKLFTTIAAVRHNELLSTTPPVEKYYIGQKLTEYTYWNRKTYPEAGETAKNLTLEALARIKKICDENNIRLVIVTIPVEEQVYSVHESGEDFDIRYPQQFVLDFAAQHKLPALDLLPGLRQYVRENGNVRIYFMGDVHFNNIGYEVAGRIVADFLKSIGQAKQ